MAGAGILFHKHFLAAVLLGLICAAAFFNSLRNDFMIDDYGLILQESRGHHLSSLILEFIPDAKQASGIRDAPDNVYYRPWAHIAPLACYIFFQNDPFGYHVVNLVLFWLAGLCIYAFIIYAFKDAALAFLTALFFLIHPVNGLAVNYITASVFSIQTAAMFLGLIAGMKSVDTQPRWLWVILGIFGFVNALLCHEAALAFPFYLTACLLLVKRLPWKGAVKYSLPFWLAAGGYFIFRMIYASLKTGILDKITDISVVQYLASFTQLVLWYFKCLLTLDGIVLIWSTPVVQTYTWMLIAVLFVLVSAAVFLTMRLRRTPHALWLVWLMIAFLPVMPACFFQPRSGLMIEPHWLIAGSVGFFGAAAAVVLTLQRQTARIFGISIAVVIALCCIAAGWSYNRLWGDEEKYCLYWREQTPRLKSVSFYLAGAYARKNDLARAKTAYLDSLEGEFLDHEAFNNLGLIAMSEGDLTAAQDYFLKTLEIHPESSIALTNLGAVSLKFGQTQQAERYFRSALELHPYLIEPRLNLAKILQEEGRLPEAIQFYLDNDAIDPTDDRNLWELAQAYQANGQEENFVRTAQRFLKMSSDAKRLTQAGSLLAEHEFPQLAGGFFEKALRINPNHRQVYEETGKWLGNMNRFDEAIALWEEGLRRFPEDPQLKALILQAQEFKKGIR